MTNYSGRKKRWMKRGRYGIIYNEGDWKRMKRKNNRIKKRGTGIHPFLDRVPLFAQLLVLMTLITALMLSYLIIRDYQENRASVLEQRVTTSERLLNLEGQNLEQYIREFASFSLQPRLDTRFEQIISGSGELSTADETYIKNMIKIYCLARNDLRAYEIYFCNRDMAYGRQRNSQHVTRIPDSEIKEEEGFQKCLSGKYYNAVISSESEGSFCYYYQAIINIKDRTPAAVVRLELDRSFADGMNREHQTNGEFLCILNQEGELLYSGNSLLTEEKAQEILKEREQTGSAVIRLDGEEYYGADGEEDPYGLRMVSFFPMQAVNEEIQSIMRSSVLTAVVLWLIAVAGILVILRLVTRPLTKLSEEMNVVGEGNFEDIPQFGGSAEIADLNRSFHEMVEHIDRLIKQNYLSEISEKTARLEALEAQINPHFLYNTLQAIGTEALINDQPQINRMITSLASNLRYSIKGGDLVMLEEELTYTKNYILLQKMRLEDRLTVIYEIDEETKRIRIPKISMQTLTENSIIHGMGLDKDTIRIEIHSHMTEHAGRNMLELRIRDDGCGISEEQIEKMKQEFQDYMKNGTVGKIGLANLYTRLRILYDGEAELEIDSPAGGGTEIVMRIPADTAERRMR